MEQQTDEISFKDIFLKLHEFWSLTWEKRYWVVIVAVLFSLIFGLRAYLKKPTYTAELTFMVNDDEGGGMAGLGAILGQFGLGGSGGGKYNYEKIMEISRSNRIVEQVLMDSAVVEGKKDVLANHIIEIYGLHKVWNKDTILNDFIFTSRVGSDQKTNLAKKILRTQVMGNPKESSDPKLASIGFNEESTIMSIAIASENEDLSIALAKSWYNKLATFYINKSIERQQTTYQLLSFKADSIYRLLVGSESSLASSTEKRGLVLASDNLPQARSSRNIQMYAAMYGEVIKNKETAEFILNNETPFFQVIDSPMVPLNQPGNNVIVNSIVGFIMGMFITTLFFGIRLYYKSIMD